MFHQLKTWHRRLGAFAALFAIMLSVTGILLNHTEAFGLDKRYLDWPWLLEHYGVAEVEADRIYLLEDKVISQFDEQIFVDSQPVTTNIKPILGGIHLEDITVIAAHDELMLLSHDGELIEQMGGAMGVPSQIQNIGIFHGLPVLQTRSGMWRSDELLEQWEAISLNGVSWSEPTSMPTIVAQDLARYFYGKGVSVERFVLDLHNGHIIGNLGVFLLDIVAVILVLLSLSGLWMWVKRS